MTRKKIFALISFFTVAANSFAAKKNNDVPEWVKNHNAVFSPTEYIAFKGIGNKAETAKNNAASELSYYFSIQVSSKREVNYKSTEISEKNKSTFSSQQNVSNVTNVSTNMNLVAVEFTDVYYDKKSKTYYCVAYMNRESAWYQYKPTVDKARDNFYGFYKKGTEDTDSFSRIRFLGYAYNAATKFLDTISFAQIISESKVMAEYGNDMKVMAKVNSELQSEKIKNKFFITVNEDSSDMVFSAVSGVFNDEGFSITQNRDEATYNVYAEINYNKSQDGKIIVMRPSVRVVVSGNSGDVYSFSSNTPRVTQYTEKRAKEKSAADVAEVVAKNMPEHFRGFMEGGR